MRPGSYFKSIRLRGVISWGGDEPDRPWVDGCWSWVMLIEEVLFCLFGVCSKFDIIKKRLF